MMGIYDKDVVMTNLSITDARFRHLRVYKEKGQTKIDFYEKVHVFMVRYRSCCLYWL